MLTPSPVQSTYTRYLTVGQNGMPATMSGWDIDTRIAEDPAATGIGFGLAVSQGTLHGDRSACIGQLSGKPFIGITVADPTLPNINTTVTDKYQDTDNMAVAVRGDWWVTTLDNVAAGGPVYYDSATGQLGASGIANAVQILGATWMTSVPTTDTTMTTETGNLAVVRLVGIAAL